MSQKGFESSGGRPKSEMQEKKRAERHGPGRRPKTPGGQKDDSASLEQGHFEAGRWGVTRGTATRGEDDPQYN